MSKTVKHIEPDRLNVHMYMYSRYADVCIFQKPKCQCQKEVHVLTYLYYLDLFVPIGT